MQIHEARNNTKETEGSKDSEKRNSGKESNGQGGTDVNRGTEAKSKVGEESIERKEELEVQKKGE